MFDPLTSQVSLFGAGINTKAGQHPYLNGNLANVFDWIYSWNLMQLTFDLRRITDEKEQKAFKAQRLPFVTFAGTFSYRNEKGLIAYSGLQAHDIDHLDGIREVRRVKELLLADPNIPTVLLFRSPRGNGLKWVFPIDLSRGTYHQWFAATSNYLRSTYGIQVDPAPSNPASACFLCYDPDMFIHPDVEPF